MIQFDFHKTMEFIKGSFGAGFFLIIMFFVTGVISAKPSVLTLFALILAGFLMNALIWIYDAKMMAREYERAYKTSRKKDNI